MICCALILAAGYSSRMKGHLKPLLTIEGKTFLEIISSKIHYAGISDIFVVTGYKSNIVRKSHSHVQDFTWVENPDYPKGQFSSLQQGLKEIQARGKYTGILYQPVDLPLIKKETYQQLLKHFLENKAFIIKPVCNKRTGHPIIFPFSLIESILPYPVHTITSKVFEKNVLPLSVNDPDIFIDFDFYEDYITMDKR